MLLERQRHTALIVYIDYPCGGERLGEGWEAKAVLDAERSCRIVEMLKEVTLTHLEAAKLPFCVAVLTQQGNKGRGVVM